MFGYFDLAVAFLKVRFMSPDFECPQKKNVIQVGVSLEKREREVEKLWSQYL